MIDTLKKIREALEFYADNSNWVARMGLPPAREDQGDKASEALALLDRVIEGGTPHLRNRADGVNGHYCISRKSPRGNFYEFWNNGEWTSAGQVFDLTATPRSRTEGGVMGVKTTYWHALNLQRALKAGNVVVLIERLPDCFRYTTRDGLQVYLTAEHGLKHNPIALCGVANVTTHAAEGGEEE